jgi:tagatose-6-phosphate ketose/aldose isomerase
MSTVSTEDATVNTLLELVALPEEEKQERGLQYTPAEIAQQPASWKTTFASFEHDLPRLTSFLAQAGVWSALAERPTVLLTGAGTSDYIGRTLVLLLREQWSCEVLAVPSTSLLTSFDAYLVPGKKYLCISFSRSGDSPEGVSVLEQAMERYPDMAQLVVTCNAQSRMFALGNAHPRGYVAVLDDAVNDRSLAMTSSFTNMVVYGQCLAHAATLKAYGPILDQMAGSAELFLTRASARARSLASRNFRRVCFVGSDALAAVAQEAALKVLEMTSGEVQTMSETVLGLRHGPMAALNNQTLFVCFLSGEPLKQPYELDLVREVEDKGITAQTLVIGSEQDSEAAQDTHAEYLAIPGRTPDAYRAPLDVMFGQLLGLFSSIEHGMKPDAPSPQGVISRVVQDFRMYR